MTPLRQQLIQELVLRGMADRTQEAYIHQVYHLTKFYRLAPDQLTEQQVRDYLFYLADQRKLSASTVNQAVNAFRFFYHHVAHRDLEVLRRALPHPRKPIRRPQVFAITELERLFTIGCPHVRDRAFLMTVYGAGLRLNEACHLRPEHILTQRRQIRVVQGKGKKDRYTLLSQRLLEELRRYWKCCRPRQWLFPSRHDPTRPMVEATAQRTFNQAVKRAGLPNKGGIHSLRHSFATHLLEMGVEITIVQRFLGHSSLSTTSNYLHVRQERLAEVGGPLQLLDLSALSS
ncbi:MAG: site-specific integrase [Rhodoferax sp.]|nr:site-specific integrase [Rhodoferax sp.]